VGTGSRDKETGWARYSKEKYAGLILVFAIPWASLFFIGLPLIFSTWVGVLYDAILIFFLSSFSVVSAAILYSVYRYRKYGKQEKVKPTGRMKPRWINTLNIVADSSIGDIAIAVLLASLAVTKSSYPQPISLELLAIIIPVVLLTGVIFRSAVLTFLGRDFTIPLGDVDTTLWVNACLAKVLLSERRARGIMYLRNSLAIIRGIFTDGGRLSKSLNDAIHLTHFAFKTGIQVNYERLLQLAKRIFPEESPPRLDQVPDQCRYLIDDLDFDWFKDTEGVEGSDKNQKTGDGQRISGFLQRVLQVTGFGSGGGLVLTLLQHSGQVAAALGSLSSLSNKNPIILAVTIILIASLTSYVPVRQILQVLSVWVWPPDLADYSRGYGEITD
jgi:hypothetical protein